MKAIAQTTGDFELFDMMTGAIVGPDRPRVVAWSQFFQSRTGAGQIKVLAGGLPAEADDAEFAEYWAEAPDMAVEAYLTSVGVGVEADEPEAPPAPAEPEAPPAPAEPEAPPAKGRGKGKE